MKSLNKTKEIKQVISSAYTAVPPGSLSFVVITESKHTNELILRTQIIYFGINKLF